MSSIIISNMSSQIFYTFPIFLHFSYFFHNMFCLTYTYRFNKLSICFSSRVQGIYNFLRFILLMLFIHVDLNAGCIKQVDLNLGCRL